jgi:N utilization substance protein B
VKGVAVADVIAGLPLAPDPYATALATATDERRASIDERLAARSHRWEVHRMPAVDRAVLRLAVAELETQPDVPAKVVINEAVELATRYSTDQSPTFVNGMLSGIAKDIRPAELGQLDE